MEQLVFTEGNSTVNENVNHFLRTEILKNKEDTKIDKNKIMKIAKLNTQKQGYLSYNTKEQYLKYVI